MARVGYSDSQRFSRCGGSLGSFCCPAVPGAVRPCDHRSTKGVAAGEATHVAIMSS
jgi:hypothetical protein